MPNVLRANGYRFFFYSNEGDPREPAHIHVMKGGAEMKIWLEPQISVAESHGFNASEQRAIYYATGRSKRGHAYGCLE